MSDAEFYRDELRARLNKYDPQQVTVIRTRDVSAFSRGSWVAEVSANRETLIYEVGSTEEEALLRATSFVEEIADELQAL